MAAFTKISVLILLSFVCGFCQAGPPLKCDPGKPISLTLPGTINWQKPNQTERVISPGWHTVNLSVISHCIGDGWKTLHDASGKNMGSFIYGGKNYAMYATPIEGISYILEVIGYSGGWEPVTSLGHVSSSLIPSYWYDLDVKVGARIMLVANDINLKSGLFSIPPFDVLTTYVLTGAGMISGSLGAISASGTFITAKSRSCTLDSPGVVNMPKVNTSLFKSVGDTVGDTAFNISLVCADSFVGYKVSYYMTDVYDATNTGHILVSPKGQGSLSGIAVQVADGPNPVKLGSAGSVLIGSVGTAGGNLAKQFTARYKRTGAQMTPGPITAAVTITLVYD